MTHKAINKIRLTFLDMLIMTHKTDDKILVVINITVWFPKLCKRSLCIKSHFQFICMSLVFIARLSGKNTGYSPTIVYYILKVVEG